MVINLNPSTSMNANGTMNSAGNGNGAANAGANGNGNGNGSGDGAGNPQNAANANVISIGIGNAAVGHGNAFGTNAHLGANVNDPFNDFGIGGIGFGIGIGAGPGGQHTNGNGDGGTTSNLMGIISHAVFDGIVYLHVVCAGEATAKWITLDEAMAYCPSGVVAYTKLQLAQIYGVPIDALF